VLQGVLSTTAVCSFLDPHRIITEILAQQPCAGVYASIVSPYQPGCRLPHAAVVASESLGDLGFPESDDGL
jgi:hypothetical protein